MEIEQLKATILNRYHLLLDLIVVCIEVHHIQLYIMISYVCDRAGECQVFILLITLFTF